MNTLTTVEFFRLRSILDTMVQKNLISRSEASDIMLKSGYTIISEFEYGAPDGSILKLIEK